MGLIGFLATHGTTILHCVKSQKSTDLIYVTKEDSNHAEEFVLVGIQYRLENLALCLACIFMWIYSESRRIKNQLDATYYIIVLLIGSTCFGHYYANHQELATMMLITTLVIPFAVCWRLCAVRLE